MKEIMFLPREVTQNNSTTGNARGKSNMYKVEVAVENCAWGASTRGTKQAHAHMSRGGRGFSLAPFLAAVAHD